MKLVPVAVSTRVARGVLLSRKNSPTILFTAGVAGMVGSTVLACKATLDLHEVLDETQKHIEMVKEAQSMPELEHDNDKHKAALRALHITAALKVAKLYAPAIVVGIASITAVSTSQRILTRRNAALTAAYAGLDKAYREYRGRVAKEVGEDKEREIYYDYTPCEIVGEDGKKTKGKQVGPGQHSPYGKFFDQTCKDWQPDAEYNLLFLGVQQDFANRRLQTRGHLFLNEVYDALGIPHTREGAIVGWVINKDGSGDNFVDFGLTNARDEDVRAFVNGFDKAIFLDFNVDGVIYDKLK